MRLLIIEDNKDVVMALRRGLRTVYIIDIATTGAEGLHQIEVGEYDLILLDLTLPDMDGLEVCRTLRGEGLQVPVLVLTARSSEIDAVVGLDAGADDYVSKPFRTAELMARIRALLRRGRPGLDVVRVQDLVIETASRRAWKGDEELILSLRQFDLLAFLASHPGQVLSREEIMRQVWQTSWIASTKTVDMHVSWLRRALSESR